MNTKSWEALKARTPEALRKVTVTETTIKDNPALLVTALDVSFYLIADPGDDKWFYPEVVVIQEAELGSYIATDREAVGFFSEIHQKTTGEFYYGEEPFSNLKPLTVVNLNTLEDTYTTPLDILKMEANPDIISANGEYIWYSMLPGVPENPEGYKWLITHTDLR